MVWLRNHLWHGAIGILQAVKASFPFISRLYAASNIQAHTHKQLRLFVITQNCNLRTSCSPQSEVTRIGPLRDPLQAALITQDFVFEYL